MAFDNNRNKAATFSKILSKMGYNNAKDLQANCMAISGDPNSVAVHTGVQGCNLVYDRTNDVVYIRTGAMTSAGPSTRAACTFYVQILP